MTRIDFWFLLIDYAGAFFSLMALGKYMIVLHDRFLITHSSRTAMV